jgi:hypothetical protein
MAARPFIRWLAAAALIVFLALLVLAVAAGPARSSRVGAAVATLNITLAGPGAPVAVGTSFDVRVSVDSGETLFNAYQVEIDVPAGLTFMSGTREASGTFPSCSPWSESGAHPPVWWLSTCSHSPPDTTFAGLVETVTLRCDSGGTFSLNLVDQGEDPDPNGSVLFDQNGPVTTNLTPDGQETVTCTPAVGGIAEIPPLAGASPEQAAAPGEPFGWSGGSYAAVAGIGVSAAAAILISGWYVRRRWLT